MPLSRILRTVSIIAFGFGRIKPGEHLVEQQQTRARRQGARQFQPFLAGGGQRACQRVGAVAEPDHVDDLARHLARRSQRQRFAAETGADRAIVEHAQPAQRLHDLMRAGDAVTGRRGTAGRR